MKNSPIEFQTQRLLLRQWRAADREPFAALNADPALMAHFPARLTRQQSDATADYCERHIAQHGYTATFQHSGVPEGPLRTHCNYRLSREQWLSSSRSA